MNRKTETISMRLRKLKRY